MLAITDFDINDVRDFAVPDITSMFRNRTDWVLTTIITVAAGHSAALEKSSPDTSAVGALCCASSSRRPRCSMEDNDIADFGAERYNVVVLEPTLVYLRRPLPRSASGAPTSASPRSSSATGSTS